MEIVLIRHGKPEAASNPTVSAGGFTQWVRRYNHSLVSDASRPNPIIDNVSHYHIVASDLPRAIHSTKLYTQQLPQSTCANYREMDIPRYKLPIKLKAWTWVYLNRGLWMLGLKGRFESFKQAKARAEVAGEQLVQLAQKHQKVMLFGHGFMNLYIRRYLAKNGWQVNQKSNQYWGESVLSSTAGKRT